MANRIDRPPPTAYPNQSALIRANRRIILSTGRGCMTITPAEARTLAGELLRLAGLAADDAADTPTRVVSMEAIRREHAAAVEATAPDPVIESVAESGERA